MFTRRAGCFQREKTLKFEVEAELHTMSNVGDGFCVDCRLKPVSLYCLMATTTNMREQLSKLERLARIDDIRQKLSAEEWAAIVEHVRDRD